MEAKMDERETCKVAEEAMREGKEAKWEGKGYRHALVPLN